MITCKNPILSGFYPDPSICRVGEWFYLVLSGYIYFCIFSGNSCISQQKSGTMGADRQYIDTGEPDALTGL